MRERVIYECEYCSKKKLMNKTAMKRHEDVCWYNPKNKTCVTCKHGEIYPKLGNINRECHHPSRITNFEGAKPKVNCLLWEDWSEIEEE